MQTVITIGRQYGSAGHEIGEKVAKYFEIPFYDKSILTRAA
ncbi:MAG: cytidylate kinase family protein, partial [Lachnospiraceae bacterium]|nr:cytidylate kinase family protein [Lachnospiraceae bacterium]